MFAQRCFLPKTWSVAVAKMLAPPEQVVPAALALFSVFGLALVFRGKAWFGYVGFGVSAGVMCTELEVFGVFRHPWLLPLQVLLSSQLLQ